MVNEDTNWNRTTVFLFNLKSGERYTFTEKDPEGRRNGMKTSRKIPAKEKKMTGIVFGEKEGARGSEKVARHCAANVVQASASQQRLLWRPTMGLRGAPTAETRRNGREERSRGGGGGGTGLQENLTLKTTEL